MIEPLEYLTAKVKRLEVEKADLLKLVGDAQSSLVKMKYALRRHHCSDPDYHLKGETFQ